MNYLVNNYYIEIYKAPLKNKFFLSDNPIIVNQIEGIDYFMPLSSNYAIVMKKISRLDHCILLFVEKFLEIINRDFSHF